MTKRYNVLDLFCGCGGLSLGFEMAGFDVNLKKFKVDQIYVLRKQKNTDRKYRLLPGYVKNPIYPDVVENLFEMVRTHLTTDWNNSNS